MVSDTDTIFFPGNQRDCSEADWFRSYAFNFGTFGSGDRTPFGSLVAVNEHTLKQGRSFSFTFNYHSSILLIPLVGELHYNFGDVRNRVDVGQSSLLSLHLGTPLSISNEYTASPIQFLEVCVRSEKERPQSDNIFAFALDDSDIIPVTTSTHHQFFIGKLRGRHDVIFEKRMPHSRLFVFDVSGTCEVHRRLLLPGDGLSLNNERAIEFEALTPEAIVFVAEVSLEDRNVEYHT